MRQISYDRKDRKYDNIQNPSKKETARPWKMTIPLRVVNQEARTPICTKLLKSSEQHPSNPEKENRLDMQDYTPIFHKKTNVLDWKRSKVVGNNSSVKTRSTAVVSCELSRCRRDGELRKTLLHMKEKFSSASEELQAAEEELTELRTALSNAKRTIEFLRMENTRQAEEIKSVDTKKQKNDLAVKKSSGDPDLEMIQVYQKIPSAGFGPVTDLAKLADEFKEEKIALHLALENSKAEVSRVMLENGQLKMIIEEERKEWDQMQKDLLVAVKVANDFKMEAQKKMLLLSEKINELQRRLQSAEFITPQGSPINLYEEKFYSWEDEAWQRLMLGCKHGSRRNALLRWCQEAVAKFSHVEITNFSSSWADGQALCYLLASFYPDKLNSDEIYMLEAEQRLRLALNIFADMGVEVKMEVADFRKDDRPEWSVIMRYILNLYYVISTGSHC